MTLFNNSFFYLIIQLVSLGASVSISILITRTTGASGKGIYSLLTLIISMAVLLTGLGINSATVYFFGQKKHRLTDMTATLVTSSLFISLIATIGLGISYLFLKHSYYREITPTQFGIALLILPASQFSSLIGAIILGMNKPLHFATISLTQMLITLTAQGALYGAGWLTPGSALASWGSGVYVGLIINLILVSRIAPISLGLNLAFLKELISFGMKAYIANLSSFFNYRLDSLMINGLLNVANVGYYSIAVSMAEVIWYVANAVSMTTFPHIASVKREEADKLIPVVCRNTLFITLLGAATMFFIGRTLIVMAYTEKMLPAVYPLWLLLPGVVSLSLDKVMSSYLSGIGKPIYATYVSALNLLLTVVLDLWLIPSHGIMGAAIASSIVYTTATLLTIILFLRESGNNAFDTLIVKPEDFRRYWRIIRQFRSLKFA